MKILEWLSGLAASMKRSKDASDRIGETLEEIDAIIRERAGLPPRAAKAKALPARDK